jgi:hypothetical protein
MTGGKSTHGSGKKWEEKEIQGEHHFSLNMMTF